jgi:hypothetical protein
MRTGTKRRYFIRCFAAIALLPAMTLPLAAQTASSQAYSFSTFAGYSRTASVDGAGSDAQLIEPGGVTVDTNGNLFVTDTFSYTVRKITPAGVVTTIAGYPPVSTYPSELRLIMAAICMWRTMRRTSSGELRRMAPIGS